MNNSENRQTIADEATSNRQIITNIKRRLDLGNISYDQAKAEAKPTIDAINRKAREIAKKYGVRPRLVSFEYLMR